VYKHGACQAPGRLLTHAMGCPCLQAGSTSCCWQVAGGSQPMVQAHAQQRLFLLPDRPLPHHGPPCPACRWWRAPWLKVTTMRLLHQQAMQPAGSKCS
jgi:hypothetical protein